MRFLAFVPKALALALAWSAAAAANTPLKFEQANLAAAARALPLRGTTRLEGVVLGPGLAPVAFELERFAVFAPDAVVEVHGGDGNSSPLPVPDNAYLRGTVEGHPGARVVLTAFGDGSFHGWLVEPGQLWAIGPDESDGGRLVARAVDLKQASNQRPFACANGDLQTPEPSSQLPGPPDGAVTRAPSVGTGYTARVAVETDFEFHTVLGSNASNSLNYIGDLFAYSSSIYAAEVDTTLLVSSVTLWSTAADPWIQTTSACSMREFGYYWNVNRSGVSRATTHMLSGKPTFGGTAWIGVLCRGAFTDTAPPACAGLPAQGAPPNVYGGNYSFTGNILGTFDLGNPTQMWDIIAMSHEIGHNFNSPHTHCYKTIGGDPNPVDGCYNADPNTTFCHAGAQGLPGQGSLTGGSAGASNGTLMGYCHLLTGSYQNVALTFGATHPFGIAPARVSARMHDHVVARAAAVPGCLPLDLIFEDGFQL